MPSIDRIVILHDFATPRGGASILAVEAVKQYRALGLPVTMFTGDAANPDLARLGIEQVSLNAHALLEQSPISALRLGYHRRETVERLTAWIAENDTPGTVYHMHNWSQILSPSVFIALRDVAERTLITCHDFFNACPNGAFLHFGESRPCSLKPLSLECTLSQCDRRNPLHKAWRVARHHHLYALADFENAPYTFSFIHERMAERFAEAGLALKDTVAIRNPVRAWHHERIPAENNSGFLFVGRVGRDKGADLALDATQAQGEALTLVGAGELVERDQGAHPMARFVGWKSPEEITEISKHARALIVPSRLREPFGLVILEAAMSGLPVIVSDQAYLATEVTQYGFGKSFAISKSDSLGQIIRAVADDDQMVRQMSEAGFASADALCHSPESWAQAHIDVFQRKLAAIE